MYTKKGLEWVYSDSKETGTIELQTIGLTVPIEEIYDRIVLPPARLLRKDSGSV